MNPQVNRNMKIQVISGVTIVISALLSVFLLRNILYENDHFYVNLLFTVCMSCSREYFIKTGRSLRMHEILCLLLFALQDRNLFKVSNVLLILAVGHIRDKFLVQESFKKLHSLVIGLIFLLIGWSSVGRILVIYNFTTIIVLIGGMTSQYLIDFIAPEFQQNQ